MKTYPSPKSPSLTKKAGFRSTRTVGRDGRLFAGIVRFCVIVAFVGSVSMIFYSASSASSLHKATAGGRGSVSAATITAALPASLMAKERERKLDTARKIADQSRIGINPWLLTPFPMSLVQGGPSGETITTYAQDCTTPKSDFTLGEIVCAKITGAPLGAGGTPAQRITWVAHNGAVAQAGNVINSTQTGTYLLPTSATQTLGGVTIDNRGTWRVNTSSTSDGSLVNTALFTVHDPAGNFADLTVNQGVNLAASEVGTVGSNGEFGVVVTNLGPDTAQNITFTEPVPANTTFVSFTQVSGPTFICTRPSVGGTGAVSCTTASLAKDAAASFKFVYQISSTSGGSISNTATVSSTTADPDTDDNSAAAGVTLPGGTPPSTCSVSCPISITQDSAPNQSGAVVTYQAPTGTDSSCGAISCDHPSGSFFPIGQTTVTCEAETGDACSFMVTINDTRPLVITLEGTNPLGIECHTSFVDPGVTATSPDPNATVTVTTSGTVDANTPGTYTITYSASDGTHSATATRTVNVEDTTPPTITLAGANPMTVECHSTFTDPGATAATDSCSGDLPTSSIQVSGTVDPNVPGTYTVTYTITDPAGNQGAAVREVNVVDTTPPTLTLVGANPMTVECHTAFTDPGATATDTCAGDLTSAINMSGSVNPDAVGTYTRTYTVSDGSNTRTATRTVNVVDTTPPTISCPANITVTLPLNTSATSMPVNFTVGASDSCGGVTVTSTPASGSSFPVGTTTVNSTATDAAGNTSSCSFTVTVRYNFTGFFSPVSNLPTFNIVNAGRAIPVKFSLSGSKGLSIFAANSPQSGVTTCDASAPATDLTDTVTAGGSSLSYSANSDQYNYVWATNSSWAGTCRQLVVTLNDGSIHVANFKFR